MMLVEVPPASLSYEEATAFQSHQFVKAFITLLVTLCALVCVQFASRVFLRRLDEEELRRLEEEELRRLEEEELRRLEEDESKS
jgi:hypothetical protein